MPDNTNPAAKPDPAVTPDEFDFDLPTADNPRIKRRSLKPRPAPMTPLTPAVGAPPAARELEHEAPPLAPEAVRPEYKSQPEDDDDAEINAAVIMTEPPPSSAQPSPATAKPGPSVTGYTPRTTSSTNPNQPASPHGTRPATMYYSTGTRKDKEDPSPMKPTPTASPTPSPTTSSTSSTARSTTAPGTRPSTVVDYRTNVERQAREQKSVGGVLAILVYVLIAFFVLGASLAGYGLYAISQQLKQQSMTMDGLNQRIDTMDKGYAEKHELLAAQLNSTIDTLTKAQAQIAREQELIVQQQETINKLIATNETTAAALRARANETANLRARVSNLENREQPR